MQSLRCMKGLCKSFGFCLQAMAGDRLDKRALLSECTLPRVDCHLIDILVIVRGVGYKRLCFTFLLPSHYRMNV